MIRVLLEYCFSRENFYDTRPLFAQVRRAGISIALGSHLDVYVFHSCKDLWSSKQFQSGLLASSRGGKLILHIRAHEPIFKTRVKLCLYHTCSTTVSVAQG